MAVACMICMSSKMSDHKSLSEGSEIGVLNPRTRSLNSRIGNFEFENDKLQMEYHMRMMYDELMYWE